MEVTLFKKPKSPIIIEGFPGFGLVGTIATEFLIDHLDCELVGKIWLEDLPAMVAIHEGEVVEPLGVFYNKKHNVMIIHGITAIKGVEWKIADAVLEIARSVKAKEIISLEGVGTVGGTKNPACYYFSSDPKRGKLLAKAGCNDLKEGIIMGVTGSILVRADKMTNSCIFAETQSNLPDSKAAAQVIKVLDDYLGLKVDYKPLLDQATEFEQKLKGLVQAGKEAENTAEKKRLSYFG